MFRYSARLLATHSIRLFPLHFSFRASSCATRFRFHSTALSLPSGRKRPTAALKCHSTKCSLPHIFIFLSYRKTTVTIAPLAAAVHATFKQALGIIGSVRLLLKGNENIAYQMQVLFFSQPSVNYRYCQLKVIKGKGSTKAIPVQA